MPSISKAVLNALITALSIMSALFQKLLVFPDALLLHITLLENRVGQQPALVPRVCPVAVPPDQGEAGHQQGEDQNQHSQGTGPDGDQLLLAGLPVEFDFFHGQNLHRDERR